MKPEPMTADQARAFTSYSVANAVTVKACLACGCEPYRDVFTYRRWRAQGFQVQRGEKAIKIPVVKAVERENRDTGEKETRKILGSGAVFCRCQVREIGAPVTEITNHDDQTFNHNGARIADRPDTAEAQGFTIGGFYNKG